MKRTTSFLLLTAFILLLTALASSGDKTPNKYIGVKSCSMCHKSEKSGNQFGIWEKTKHASAYKSLLSPKAAEIAKNKGLKTPASESVECLSCHTIQADAKLTEKNFDSKDGVQCEVCHGAGSAYKSMQIMKDRTKSIAAGMTEFKDEAAIEKQCRSCHNEKSPTFKEFKFKESWAKIKHSK